MKTKSTPSEAGNKTVEAAKGEIVIEDTVHANTPINSISLTIPFSVATSHQIERPDFSGANTMTWHLPYQHEGIQIDNLGQFRFIVRKTSPTKYSLEVESESAFASTSAELILTTIQRNLTFLLNRQNPNPHYGTYFIDLEFAELRLASSTPGVSISGHLSIRAEGLYQSNADDWTHVSQSPIIDYYFEGARAADPKSKYFQWFRIVERLEGSNAYLNKMGWHALFSTEEQEAVNTFADKFMEGSNQTRKSSAIRDLLKRTEESRAEKLAAFLKHLGIAEYGRPGHRVAVEAKTLKAVIGARNTLFHAGSTFDEQLLWRQLFPLATTVTEADRNSPLALE